MDLWKILVLGNLGLNCNWDNDKLHNIANNHMNVREIYYIFWMCCRKRPDKKLVKIIKKFMQR